jgi:hypothetical protein
LSEVNRRCVEKVSVNDEPCLRLELCEAKVSRTVLKGVRGLTARTWPENQIMDELPNSKHYAWAVQVGMVEVWRKDGQLHLRSSLDSPSGSPACSLTKQDALEIATILYHLAQGSPDY